jgi:type IV secretory pathway ATPase VirB11/archaellum biosynthesis ATPase
MGTLRQTVKRALTDREADCRCVPTFEGNHLVVDASSCGGDGALRTEQACRATAVEALTGRDVTDVRVRSGGIERVYETDAAALLVAAGRFVDAIGYRDDRLAERARRDPLGAAREATGRAGAPATIAAETGLAILAEREAGYERLLAPLVGLTISDWRVDTTPPTDGELTDVRDLPTGDTARIYRTDGVDRYVLSPLESAIDDTDARLLSTAYDRLADGVGGGERAPRRALRQAADATEHTTSITTLGTVLHRHTHGHGLLGALFADAAVSDVFATAPVADNPLQVRVDDRTLPTNVRLTERGGSALAARYRRESGRGFSRANPTLDAAATIHGRQIRVAGVTEPVSDGVAFAFRAHDRDAWTLPELVDNGTLTARAAALLSLVVERGGAMLVAGPRGAGKTTLLGALLPELPPEVRAVVIEDTPELPVGKLQRDGRDVQALRASQEEGELSATEAVRTALRLGDGALVVGEIRGEEAQSLYEAMRVGANSEAVLGTVHGNGAKSVYDRVVDDLGVPATSFRVTDAVVTLERTDDGSRRVSTIEEVADGEPVAFDTLFHREGEGLAPSGRLDRGNSRLLETVSRPEEAYADVQAALNQRRETLTRRARAGEKTRNEPGFDDGGS